MHPSPSVDDAHAPPTWQIGEFRLRALSLLDAAAWYAHLSDPRVIEHTSFPRLDPADVDRMVADHLDLYGQLLADGRDGRDGCDGCDG